MRHFLIQAILVTGICQSGAAAAEDERPSNAGIGTGVGQLPPGVTLRPSDPHMYRATQKRAEEEGRGWSAGYKALPPARLRSLDKLDKETGLDRETGLPWWRFEPDLPDGMTVADWEIMRACRTNPRNSACNAEPGAV